MKKQMLQKLLTTTAGLLSCALLVGNTLPLPTPPQDGDDIVIELPVPEDEDSQPECTPMGDDKPLDDEDL